MIGSTFGVTRPCTRRGAACANTAAIYVCARPVVAETTGAQVERSEKRRGLKAFGCFYAAGEKPQGRCAPHDQGYPRIQCRMQRRTKHSATAASALISSTRNLRRSQDKCFARGSRASMHALGREQRAVGMSWTVSAQVGDVGCAGEPLSRHWQRIRCAPTHRDAPQMWCSLETDTRRRRAARRDSISATRFVLGDVIMRRADRSACPSIVYGRGKLDARMVGR